MPLDIRIQVTGVDEQERFTVIAFPDQESRKGPNHAMTTHGPMAEADFRNHLATGGLNEAEIARTIADARAHRSKTAS